MLALHRFRPPGSFLRNTFPQVMNRTARSGVSRANKLWVCNRTTF